MTASIPDLDYVPTFLARPSARQAQAALHRNTVWEQHTVRLFGRDINCPRLSAWHGDPEATYYYSGNRLVPRPWTPVLDTIRKQVTARTGTPFNSVLLNLYRTGEDSMGWHADDEPELGERPVIASVSLGARRRMRFRLKADHQQTHEQWLEEGSLLVMRGATQHDWHHALPRTRRVTEPRINLTFRHIVPPNRIR